MESENGNTALWADWLKSRPRKFKMKMVDAGKCAEKVVKEDPRRVIHAIKVGIAVTLVSMLYCYRPLYDSFGASWMWAVLTVVVVFEFTVGATLSKVVNRGSATLVASALGAGVARLVQLCGEEGASVLLGLFVFLVAVGFTLARFVPAIKARYDYGMLVFILTFSLIAVSGYRADEILLLALQRLLTILIGGATCMALSIFVCPVWAGEELHHLIAFNIRQLAACFEDVASDCFFGEQQIDRAKLIQGHEGILSSKAKEETLANFAMWEPRHGNFQFGHPWDQYLKLGDLCRCCAYQIEALNNCLNENILSENMKEYREMINESLIIMSKECAILLGALERIITTMKNSPMTTIHIQKFKVAEKNLKYQLKYILMEYPSPKFLIIPTFSIASMMIEIMHHVLHISESVFQLSHIAKFQKEEPREKHQVLPVLISDGGDTRTVTLPSYEISHDTDIHVDGELKIIVNS